MELQLHFQLHFFIVYFWNWQLLLILTDAFNNNNDNNCNNYNNKDACVN